MTEISRRESAVSRFVSKRHTVMTSAQSPRQYPFCGHEVLRLLVKSSHTCTITRISSRDAESISGVREAASADPSLARRTCRLMRVATAASWQLCTMISAYMAMWKGGEQATRHCVLHCIVKDKHTARESLWFPLSITSAQPRPSKPCLCVAQYRDRHSPLSSTATTGTVGGNQFGD
jgi:hypothetical protein